jgi:hypothetical protein
MKSWRWPVLMMTIALLALPAAAPLAAEQAAEEAAEQAAERKVTVYYFHGNKRCKTCRTIEAYTEQTLEDRFHEELGSGRLEWRVLNYEEPSNEHYLDDFGLYSSAVVLVESEGERRLRHEILTDVWTLVRDKQGFFAYINSAVHAYLE